LPAIVDVEGPPREQAAPFVAVREDGQVRVLDLRHGDDRCVAMDLDSAVIFGSAFFAAMVPDASAGGGGGRRVEVDGVDNLEVFEDRLRVCLVWVLKFNKHGNTFVLFDKKFLILN
jgi:hypothetical protein